MENNNRNQGRSYEDQYNQWYANRRDQYRQDEQSPYHDNQGGFSDMNYNEGDNRSNNQYGGKRDNSNYGQQEGGRRNTGSGYGDQYSGNLARREEETNRARGGKYMSGGGQSNRQGSNQNYNNSNQNFDNNRNRDDRGWWDRATDEVTSWFGSDDNDRREGNRQQGEHRGKGPRGYSRSDERIQEDVCHRLYEDGYVDASEMEVSVQGSDVVLSGVAHSREEKRRAIELAESVSGVKNVENRIRVVERTVNSRYSGDGRQQASGDYTGNTDNVGGIGDSSGTTNEIIRDRNKGSIQ